MPRGKRIDDKTKEQVKALLSSGHSYRDIEKETGVSRPTISKIANEKEDEINQVRTQKKEQWINDAWKTINLYIEHVQDPKVIQKTGARDSAILIGTLHDKMIKNKELDLKREELDLKRKELEEKKNESKPDVQPYIEALKGAIKDVWDE